MDVRLPDGTVITNVPENTTQADLMTRVQGFRAQSQSKPEPDLADKIAGSAPIRFALGAADPILGGVQALANLTPYGKDVNEHLQHLDQMVNRGRGGDSFDPIRFGGQFFSPVNAGLAKVMPAATSTLGRVGTGVAAGAFGGVATPVTNGGDYWQQKGAQTALSAVTGGIATPILGKLTNALGPKIEALAAKYSTSQAEKLGARASLETDSAIEQALKEIGAKAEDIPAKQMAELRQQVLGSLKQGKQKDAAAILRKADFESVGVQPTLGQITRDSTQFARERNLRGVPGVGEPLQTRFDQQNQQLQQRIGDLAGNASEAYPAGKTLADALASVDSSMKGRVKDLYNAARESAGKDAEIPLGGLANDYATVLDSFGSKVPDGLRNQFRKFGLEGGEQTKLFTVESADSLLKEINKHVGSDAATNKALGELRNAVKNAVTKDAGVEDVFSAARKAAATRFQMHDAIPALEAAASGEAPDQFVQKFVLNGKVDQVRGLAELLKKTSPEAFEEARSQLGAKIMRSAFGENVAGDKLAAPERLAKALREIGSDKLSAFYSPQEIAQMKTLSRVAAYINSVPSSAPVNYSNNIGAITGLAARIPGAPAALSLVNALRNTVNNASTVKAGVAASVPEPAAKASPEQARQLARLLTYGGVGAGIAGASALR